MDRTHQDNWGLAGDAECRLQYQREDKHRENRYKENRLVAIQRYRASQAERIKLIESKAQLRTSQNLQRFAEQQWAYNHVNHLKNEWK